MEHVNNTKRRAVSPIVAVLILIVVAVVGGGAIAVLLGQMSSQTAQQASTANTKLQAATTISIGGSTTVFPITEAVKQNFTQATGIQINDQQGGSGAGMVGVATNVLDVGASSSLSTFNNAQTRFSSANLQDFVFAGSGLVLVVHPPTASTSHFLNDGAGGTGGVDCTTITKAALHQIYHLDTVSTFGIKAPGCVGGILDAPSIDTAATTYTAFQRSDLPSGTADTWSAYIDGGNGEGATPEPGATGAVGNPGVFASVSSTAGSIGYVDISFDKSSTGKAILSTEGISSTAVAAQDAAIQDTTGAIKGSQAEKDILAGLAGTGSYPDGGGQLYRFLLYATSGAPSADVQKYFDFVGSPVARTQINNLGYYTPYDWKGQGL